MRAGATRDDVLDAARMRCGAFIYNDALAGIRGDVEDLRRVEAALLGGSDPLI